MLIKVTNKIWIGDVDAEKDAARNKTFRSVLVVANDLDPIGTWNPVNRYSYQWLNESGLGSVEDLGGIEYAHVGLVDGPGNKLATYHAAVLALAALTARGTVLVCCHDGARSLAVVIMYSYLMGSGPSWDEAIERLPDTCTVEWIHSTHRKAFFLMDWGMMARVLDREVSNE